MKNGIDLQASDFIFEPQSFSFITLGRKKTEMKLSLICNKNLGVQRPNWVEMEFLKK